MICVLGDAHLDVVVRVLGPLAEDTDTPASTSVGAGGQAANVAAWVAALGGRSRLICARGSDPAADLVTAELSARGVGLAGPVLEGRTGVVVSLSDGGARRSMLTDRGVGPQLAAGHLDPDWLADCAWLHLPAYSLVREPIAAAARAAAALAGARQARLSIDLSSTAALTEYGPDRFARLLGDLAPDVVFGTEAEVALVGEIPGPELVLKMGAAGVRAGGVHYPAVPTEALDATGAGDAFAAGYLLGGVRRGLAAAARAVARMGGMP